MTTVKINKVSYVYLLLIICGTFPIIHGWFPMLYRHVYLASIALIVSFFVVRSYFATRMFWLALIYGIIVYMNSLWGDDYTIGREVLDGLILIMCSSITYYQINSNDERFRRALVIIVFSIIAITSTATLVADYVQPGIVRMLTGENEEIEEAALLQFYKYGVADYDLVQGLPMLVAPLVLWLKPNIITFRWKLFFILSFVFTVLLAWVSDVTTVQVLLLISIVGSLLVRKNQYKKSLRRIVVVVLLLLPILNSNNIMHSVYEFGVSHTEGVLQSKMETAKYDIEHGTNSGDLDHRQNLYMKSLETFIKSPIWGVNDYTELGDHSSVFDRLAAFGIIGFLPWMLFFVSFIKYVYKTIPIERKLFFIISTACFVVLLFSKNSCRLYECLAFMVFMPSILLLDFKSIR